jgi:hypothetical protein
MRRQIITTCVLLSLCGCDASAPPNAADRSPTQQAGTAAADPRAALRRPWVQPTVRGGTCPVTTVVQRPDPALGPLLGTGPARAAGLGAGAVLEYTGPDRGDWTDRSWGGQKVLWAVDPATEGPVLVRGRRIDGPGELAFEDPAVAELLLNQTAYEGQSGGWRDYPGFTRLRSPGCYAYQIDTRDGTWSIVFTAVGPAL